MHRRLGTAFVAREIYELASRPSNRISNSRGHTMSTCKQIFANALPVPILLMQVGCGAVTVPPSSVAAHGFDTRTSTAPATCTAPAMSTTECAPFPTCAGSASCIAISANQNVCSYAPKPIAACQCFKGQEDFCLTATTPPQLGIRKCSYDTATATYRFGSCTSQTVP